MGLCLPLLLAPLLFIAARGADRSYFTDPSKPRWWASPANGLEQVDTAPFADGSYGTIYRARLGDQGCGGTVAVKEFKTFDVSRYPLHPAMEQRLQASVASPFIIKSISYTSTPMRTPGSGSSSDPDSSSSHEPRLHAIVFEYGGRTTLEGVAGIFRGPMAGQGAARAIAILRYVAASVMQGLRACHLKGILHRDISPANILIDSQGQVRVTDFGWACPFVLGTKLSTRSIIYAAGTPFYSSRHVLFRSPYGEDADWYSLGACLFYLCYQRAPLEGQVHGLDELLDWHDDGKLFSIPADLDPQASKVIERCCSDNCRYEDLVLSTLFSGVDLSTFHLQPSPLLGLPNLA